MSTASQKLVLFATLLCSADVLAILDLDFESPMLGYDFRPAKFARERYLRSREFMKSRRLGLDTNSNSSPKSLDFIALANEFDYPAEEHLVTTKDGYRLRLHRIPGSKANPKAPGKPVVFFQHGLFASSDVWILLGPSKDLAYMLVDAGYDVWFGNARGNTYSRSHVTLSPDYHPEFWQFSYHEIAMYDVPASIDYILRLTKKQKLIYIGHSMGTSISFVLLSEKPEYNDKIYLVVSLAPVALWTPYKPFVKFLIFSSDALKSYFINANLYEVLPLTAGGTKFMKISCRDGSILRSICATSIYLSSGYNISQLNDTLLVKSLSVFPAGASSKTLLHYSQNILTDSFKMYDYGTKENLRRYNQTNSPAYNLSNIATPIALFYGMEDALISPGSVKRLANELPNVLTIEEVPDLQFSHLDFLYSQNVKELLNNRIMEITLNMLKYENKI